MKMTVKEMIIALEAQGYTVSDDILIHDVFSNIYPLVDDSNIPVTLMFSAPDGTFIPMYATHTFSDSWSAFYTSDQSRSFFFDAKEEAQVFLTSYLEWYAAYGQ